MDENDFNIEESIEIDLRPIDEIVRRAVLLLSLVRRATMEEADPSGDENDAFERETDRFELYSWSKRELASVWTEEEQALLGTPAGEASPDQADLCLSASLPANAICWSLGIVDELTISDIDNLNLDRLLGWASQPWDEVSRLAGKASSRDEESIAQMRERWELWNWRAMLDETDLEPGEDLDDVVGDVAVVALETGLIEVVDGDFAVDGQPFRSINSDQHGAIAHLAENYLVALNWVCGFGDTWDNVPLYPD